MAVGKRCEVSEGGRLVCRAGYKGPNAEEFFFFTPLRHFGSVKLKWVVGGWVETFLRYSETRAYCGALQHVTMQVGGGVSAVPWARRARKFSAQAWCAAGQQRHLAFLIGQ